MTIKQNHHSITSASVDLSFFETSLHIPKEVQKISIAARTLAYLEHWLNTPVCFPKTTIYTVSELKEENGRHVLVAREAPSSSIKRLHPVLLTLKVLATLLVIPRLAAELVRFGLRKLFDVKLKKYKLEIFQENQKQIDTFIHSSISSLSHQQALPGVKYLPSSTVLTKDKQVVDLVRFTLDSCEGVIFTIVGHLPTPLTKEAITHSHDALKQEYLYQHNLQAAIKNTREASVFLKPYSCLLHKDSLSKASYLVENDTLANNCQKEESVWKFKQTSGYLENELISDLSAITRLLIRTGLKFNSLGNFPYIGNRGPNTPHIAILGSKEFLPKSPHRDAEQMKRLFTQIQSPQIKEALISVAVEEKQRLSDQQIDIQSFENQLRQMIQPVASSL